MRPCESCKQNPATIHVTEIVHPDSPAQTPDEAAAESADASEGSDAGGAKNGTPAGHQVREQHLCEVCAQDLHPLQHPVKKTAHQIFTMLQQSAQRNRRDSGVTCPDCGMSLLEFRQRGRLGCPRDYEIFAEHLDELLERIHGSIDHSGRTPGSDPEGQARMRRTQQLREALESAIREEAYEQAALLRDELKSLQDN